MEFLSKRAAIRQIEKEPRGVAQIFPANTHCKLARVFALSNRTGMNNGVKSRLDSTRIFSFFPRFGCENLVQEEIRFRDTIFPAVDRDKAC